MTPKVVMFSMDIVSPEQAANAHPAAESSNGSELSWRKINDFNISTITYN